MINTPRFNQMTFEEAIDKILLDDPYRAGIRAWWVLGRFLNKVSIQSINDTVSRIRSASVRLGVSAQFDHGYAAGQSGIGFYCSHTGQIHYKNVQ